MAKLRVGEFDKRMLDEKFGFELTQEAVKYIEILLRHAYENGVSEGYARASSELKKWKQKY